jgi:hypothetical protein
MMLLVDAPAHVIQALVDVGFCLDDRTIKKALAQTAGEVWLP